MKALVLDRPRPVEERPLRLTDTAPVPPGPGEVLVQVRACGVCRTDPIALAHLDRGGVLVLGGIHMSAIPSMPYDLLYDERVIRSVANNTRDDGRGFLAEAARVRLHTSIERLDLADVNEALLALKRGAVRGAAVLACHS